MKRTLSTILTFAAIIGCTSQKDPEIVKEPTARKVPKRLENHGDIRVDNYFWMNDREDPEVIKYLEHENSYREYVMKGTLDLQDSLFHEMKGRIKEQDESVPVFKNGFHYYVRYDEGKEYPIYCRREGSMESDEEIMLDVNVLARDHSYYQVGGLAVSPNNRYLAFGVDTLSRRLYTIHIKDLQTGEILEDAIPNTTGGSTWANDDNTLFYTLKDLTTLRSYQVRRHVMGTKMAQDVTVFTEEDETFYCGVAKSKSREFIIIGSGSTMTDEMRYIPADQPEADFTILQPRTRGLEYDAEPYDGNWYIRTNEGGATNFKLMKAPYDRTGVENWTEVIPHREDTYLEGLEIFRNFLVVEERVNGLSHMRFRKWEEKEMREIPFDEETYTCSIGANPEFDTEWLRYGYTSLTTPNSTIEYNLESGEKRLLKQQEVVGGYDPSQYQSRRVWATARDGKKVPISLVYKKDLKREKGNPLLLYGYGSYGYTVDATFSSIRLSLLDRGFIFAIAHIRGGSYLGRPWYEDGKLLVKKNTFTDFIDCAEFLVDEGYTRPEMLFAEGGSAGGLLMGAVVNMRPDLWKGVIAGVPFVDVVTTMLDESIPLTTGEYDEWGNPNDSDYYEYMLSYSPYDNVDRKNYPAILVTTGLHDSQVQYWEPAKWVAKMRDLRTDPSKPLLLYTNMETGHSGASGRFEPLKEVAMEYAFLLDLMGISK